jgi:hypothetical protein
MGDNPMRTTYFKNHLPIIIGVAALTVAGLSAAVLAASTKPAAAPQSQFLAQVQTANGSPVAGRDPQAQGQTSLAFAASQPVGNGLRTDAPAAAVKMDTSHHVDPKTVLPDPKVTGRYFNGCLVGFGKPGQDCTLIAPAGSELNKQITPSPQATATPTPTPTPTPAPSATDMPGMDMSGMDMTH